MGMNTFRTTCLVINTVLCKEATAEAKKVLATRGLCYQVFCSLWIPGTQHTTRIYVMFGLLSVCLQDVLLWRREYREAVVREDSWFVIDM